MVGRGVRTRCSIQHICWVKVRTVLSRRVDEPVYQYRLCSKNGSVRVRFAVKSDFFYQTLFRKHCTLKLTCKRSSIIHDFEYTFQLWAYTCIYTLDLS